MDLTTKVLECQTVAELSALESQYVLNEQEQALIFERKVELIARSLEWGIENEQLGLVVNLMDSWTPEQRENFMMDWQDDEPLLQMGHGEKRSIDKVNELCN